MIILPAIDIKDGECVRLVKGDFATVHQVAEDPVKTASSFRRAGAIWLHMVDLDGAVQGRRINQEVFTRVAEKSRLKVELGGGIRDFETIEYYLFHGVSRVILGSAALSSSDLVRKAAQSFGDRIAVGIDAKERMVATHGWLSTSKVDFIEMAKRMEDCGVKHLIYTDISRDGTLCGPALEHLSELMQSVSCNIIASGGIAQLSDIEALTKAGLYGAICGKSIYAGTLDLKEAIAVGGNQKC